jgi:hypothetical protein
MFNKMKAKINTHVKKLIRQVYKSIFLNYKHTILSLNLKMQIKDSREDIIIII